MTMGAPSANEKMAEESAAEFAERIRKGFERKSDHNKSEALSCYWSSIVLGLASPLFVTLGPGAFWGKIAPAILSSVAVAINVWLQKRKPNQLWALYRTCQRRIEAQQTAFRFRYDAYEKTENPDRLLAQEVARIAMFAHEQWMPLVPSPENVGPLEERKAPKLPELPNAEPHHR